jgi:hypothetical protein
MLWGVRKSWLLTRRRLPHRPGVPANLVRCLSRLSLFDGKVKTKGGRALLHLDKNQEDGAGQAHEVIWAL